LLRVKLWLDHEQMGGARTFADQAHPECARSELCLFLISDRFYLSENCKAEATHFETASGEHPRHIQVQLSGKFEDAEPRFRDRPCYPKIWRDDVGNLLQAWELSTADRDAFLTHLRDHILADIVRLNRLDQPAAAMSAVRAPTPPSHELDIADELL